jgi:signal transduction histidine kinase
MPIRANRFLRSLRFKITVGAVVLLVPILGAYSHFQYWRHHDVLMGNLERATTAMGQVITGSLRHAMLTNDFGEIQKIVDAVAQQGEIVNLAVLDKQGEIRIAPKGQTVGARLSQEDPTCQVCHRYASEQRKGSVILTQVNGRIFRTMTPIENQPECYECHDSRARLNGVLLTDISLTGVDQYLATDLRDSVLWSFAVMLLAIIAVNLMMSTLVVTKLEQLVQTIKLFGRGDLGERALIASSDEVGELADAFNRMAEGLQAKEIENKQLYDELQHKEALRGQLLEKLNNAQEEERKRIARDLHDQLGQVLSAVTMEMDAAERALPPEQAGLKQRLLHARSVAARAVDRTHELMLDLRPIVLEDLGLLAALRSYAEQHLAPHGVEIKVAVQGIARRLPSGMEITLFRIVQEAINNIAKHASAQHLGLSFDFRDSFVQVTVQDDGCGFDVTSVFDSEDQGRGLGLLGMQERATFGGGTFQIESQPGHGTRIIVTMPVAN